MHVDHAPPVPGRARAMRQGLGIQEVVRLPLPAPGTNPVFPFRKEIPKTTARIVTVFQEIPLQEVFRPEK